MRPNFLNKNPTMTAMTAIPAKLPATIPMMGPAPGPLESKLLVELAAARSTDWVGEAVTNATEVVGAAVVLGREAVVVRIAEEEDVVCVEVEDELVDVRVLLEVVLSLVLVGRSRGVVLELDAEVIRRDDDSEVDESSELPPELDPAVLLPLEESEEPLLPRVLVLVPELPSSSPPPTRNPGPSRFTKSAPS